MTNPEDTGPSGRTGSEAYTAEDGPVRDALNPLLSGEETAKLEPIRERLERYCKLDPETGCLIWPLRRTSSGFGQVSHEGKKYTPHRVVWLLNGGAIEDGFVLKHACGNKLCCNLEHLRTERRNSHQKTHGLKRAPEYQIWAYMKGRCYGNNPDSKRLYAERGIEVCDRWLHSFENFIADMGPRPTPKHTLDRIDNDGPYAPENCRWADRKAQVRNRRNTVFVTHDGERMALADACDRAGITYRTAYTRYRAGKPWDQHA